MLEIEQNKKLAKSLSVYSTEALKSAVIQENLTKEQIEAILVAKGYQGELLKTTTDEWANAASTAAMAASQTGATGTTLGLSSALKGLGATLKTVFMNPVTWVIAGLATVVGVLDLVTTSTKEYEKELNNLRDNLETVKSECSELESKLTSCNDELKTTQERMKELEKIESPTFAEKKEYDNLVATNNELERKIALLELEQKTKNAEKNKTFIDTMKKDVSDGEEYWVDNDTGIIEKGDSMWAQIGGIYASDATEADYIEQKFETRQQLLDKLSKAETQDEKDRVQTQIDEIDSYLRSKSSEWNKDSEGISYISNPTSEDDKRVNAWLDYISDFQDRMAIAMSGNDADSNAQYKEYAFNRVVDNWQFDETVRGLQNLGKEGKVTAEMLDNPKYDEFINKLIFLGVIDSADNLEDVALAFNSVATSAKNAADSASQYDDEIPLPSLKELNDQLDAIQSAYKTVSSAIEEYNKQGALSVDTYQALMEIEPQYLQYLMDEEGNLRLGTDAMNEYTAALIDNMAQKQMESVLDYVATLSDEERALYLAGNAAKESTGSLIDFASATLQAKIAAGELTYDEGRQLANMFDNIITWANAAKEGLGKGGLGDLEDASKQAKESIETTLKIYKAELDAGIIDFDNFLNKSRSMLDEYYRDGKISAADYWGYVEDLQQKQLDIYDKAISGMVYIIDKEVESLEKEQELIRENYESKIQSIQSEIDLLNEVNDSRQRQIDLEKDQFALEQAQNMRTKKVKIMPSYYSNVVCKK